MLQPKDTYLAEWIQKQDVYIYIYAIYEKTQFKSISSSVISLLYRPTLTSIHDYWKNHT